MPAYTKDGLPITAEKDGFVQRGKEVGDLLLSFDHIPKGDYASMFADLPEGRCQSPHWGYVLKGKIKITYADREEILEAGQAYYLPPGHVPTVLEDADVVQFSEPAAFHTTVETGFVEGAEHAHGAKTR